MRNSVIIEYRANDIFEFITDIFDKTSEMAKKLNISENNCRSIICRKNKHKGFYYERVWFNKKNENQ